MESIPFKIPKSLNSYVEQFETDPPKVIEKLKKQVKKRGYDAVGHFLLSWFYHEKGEHANAVKHALIAKTYAPGSPLMEHLHYYLIHPEKFEASIPEKQVRKTKKRHWSSKTAPKLDLDKLINLLSEVESVRIKLPADDEDFDDTDLSDVTEEIGEIVSETIAKIHEQQGKLKEAIKAYQKLIKRFPDKQAHFEERIEAIKAKQSN